MGFKIKLTFSYLLVILISFVFFAFFIDRHLETNSLREIESSLVNQGYAIENQISRQSVSAQDTDSLEVLVKTLSSKLNCRLTIIDKTGKVLADSEKLPREIAKMENHLSRPEVKTALSGKTGIDTRFSSTLNVDMLYVALPIKDKSEITGILRLALPLSSVKKELSAVRRIVFFSFLLALGLALILGFFLAERTLRPVNRMIQIARAYSRGDFSHKITRYPKDEIGELAETLNKMARDIEDKISQIKLKNQQLTAVFNSMIEGVIVLDKEGRIISINPPVEKIFSVLEADAQGKFFLEAIRNNDIAEIVSEVLKSKEPVSRDLDLAWPVQRVFQVNVSPIFEKSAVNGCLIVIHDITEIKKLETMRRDFVANVSHELKTPLTSIKGFVETLLEGALEDKANSRQFLSIIQDHADRLNSLINDLLDLSHMESKEISLNRQDFNLRELAEQSLSGFKGQLKKKNISAEVALPKDIMVNADRAKIEQVFTNLIDNAIKFNRDAGSIRIYSEDLDDYIKIFVEDSGVGIPEKDLSRIFERFYRVDKARSRELGGTGLGLSIVKHIIQLHSGSVGVESTEGLGSKFYLCLPK